MMIPISPISSSPWKRNPDSELNCTCFILHCTLADALDHDKQQLRMHLGARAAAERRAGDSIAGSRCGSRDDGGQFQITFEPDGHFQITIDGEPKEFCSKFLRKRRKL